MNRTKQPKIFLILFATLAVLFFCALPKNVFAAYTAIYASDGNDGYTFTGCFTVSNLKSSCWNGIIMFALTVQPNGDLTVASGSVTLVSNGVYKGDPNWGSNVTALKTPPTSVTRYELCLGGWGDTSFANIENIVNSQGAYGILKTNFQALKNACPGLDAINDDDEGNYDLNSSTAFGQMLGSIGMKLTQAPYTNQGFWVNLKNNLGSICDIVYLQCYQGGSGNDPAQWNSAYGNGFHVVPGEETNYASQSQFTTWASSSGATGGFFWPDWYWCPGTDWPTQIASGIGTNCSLAAVTPYLQVNGAAWQSANSASVPYNASVNLGPQDSGEAWSWTGPNGFTSASREIDNIPLVVGTNSFTVTNTTQCVCNQSKTFTITMAGPPSCSSSGNFGNNVAGTTWYNQAGNLDCAPYTLSQSMTVTSISIYMGTGTSGSGVAGIYSDSGGAPGNLLVQSNDYGLAPGWNTFTLAPTVLAAGTYFLSGSFSGTANYAITGNGTGLQFKSYGYNGSLPDPPGGGWTGYGWSMCVYASGCQQPAPTNTPTSTFTSTKTFTPTNSPTPIVSSSWRVNAGGPQYTDSLGQVWAADENYTGGGANGNGNAITGALPGAGDQALYQTERWGSGGPAFTYTFNVPAGSYQVTLKFAEIFDSAAGQRLVNVSINGTQVLTNFDVFADAGAANKADDKVFNNIAPAGGKITIQFSTGTGGTDANVKVSALQVISQPPTPTFTPTRTSTPTSTLTFTPTKTNTPIPPTLTFTRTFTSTNSFTSTPTSTPTSTNSPVPFTPTLTFTSSPTKTNTPPDTNTATFTKTSTPTSTNTPTSTFTNTAVPPPATSSFTFTATASFTPTDSTTPTRTLTPTFTASFTFTGTSTYSFTPTRTNTAIPPTVTSTFTPTVTKTFTLSNTLTFTPTSSFTPTSTSTFTRTNTSLPTSTFTFTQTPTNSFTRTFTPSFTPTRTLSPTPTPGTSTCSGVPLWNGNFVYYPLGSKVNYNGELYQIIQAHTSEPNWMPPVVPALWQDLGPCAAVSTASVFPNPSTSSGTVQVAVPLTSTSDVSLEIFTTNFRKILHRDFPQTAVGSDLRLELTGDRGEGLANGLYYIFAQAQGKHWVVKLLILK